MLDMVPLAEITETGTLGVMHLKRLWSSAMALRQGQEIQRAGEESLDKMLMNGLGLGLHQTLQFLYHHCPDFDAFERWVVSTAHEPDPLTVERLNASFSGSAHSPLLKAWLQEIEDSPEVLTEQELELWREQGYLLLKNAVPEAQCRAAAKVIRESVGASESDPDSWYETGKRQGIMVELIQHPCLALNRRSLRIHKAFAQLWGTADLWVSADRCGFHPPQKAGFGFPGPDLHWDLDFSQPLTFGTQGILYLTDTLPEQGALTLVPGFHQRINDWVDALRNAKVPPAEELHALGSVPVGGKAGDMVIWHQFLPHGSRPNTAAQPRIVQYINYAPGFSL